MRLVIPMSIALAVLGCSKPAREEGKKTVEQPTPRPQSSIEQVVEGMAGGTDIRAGRRAQETIRRVSAQKNKDLEEAMSK